MGDAIPASAPCSSRSTCVGCSSITTFVFFLGLTRSKSQRPGQPALYGECAKPEQTFEYDVMMAAARGPVDLEVHGVLYEHVGHLEKAHLVHAGLLDEL